jgi:hypothetical protein
MRSLGGVETCSADLGRGGEPQHAKLVLVEQATPLRLILDSVDGWLFAQRGLVNRRTRSLLPALRERVALVTALLVDLGLKRRAKTLPTLAEHSRRRAKKGTHRRVEGNYKLVGIVGTPAQIERLCLVVTRVPPVPTAVPTCPPSWGQWGQARLTRPPRRRA